MASNKDMILDLIRENPFISQLELAEKLGITRSAVASHIAQLTRDGHLLGRAYVLPGAEPILVVGGANVDRMARAFGPVVMETSNPVSIEETPGGVARNVAENLARLGLHVRLITAVGDDPSGAFLLKQARELGIDVSSCISVTGCPTGTYTALLKSSGEMMLAMADMEAIERIHPDALQARRSQWAPIRLRVVDCNLPRESLSLLIEESRISGSTLVVVAVSEPKMSRLPERMEGISLLILNTGELSTRLGRPLRDRRAVQAACREMQAKGVKRVIVTLGAKGLVYAEEGQEAVHLPAQDTEVVNVTGAGDAFSAGVVASLMQFPEDLRRACLIGQRMATMTLESLSSVASTLSSAVLSL